MLKPVFPHDAGARAKCRFTHNCKEGEMSHTTLFSLSLPIHPCVICSISGMKCATNGMEAALLKHPAMRSIPDTETSYFYSFDKSGLTNPRTAPEFLKHLPKVSKKQSEQRVYTIQSSTAHMRPPVWDVARAYSQHFPRVKIIFMLW